MPKNRIVFYTNSTLTTGPWSWLFSFLNSLEVPCRILAFSERSLLSPEYRATSVEIFYIGESNRHAPKLPVYQEDPGYIILDSAALPSRLNFQPNNCSAGTGNFDLQDDKQKILENLLIAIRDELPGVVSPRKNSGKMVSFSMDLEIDSGDDLERLDNWLDWLSGKKIRINIFLTGTTLRILRGSKKIMEMLSGHQLGNHTFNHRDTKFLNIVRNHYFIANHFSSTPRIFRAPRLEIREGMYRLLGGLGYSADSSLYGFQLFPVIIDGKNTGIIEVPLLDGGDYHFVQQKGLAPEHYREYLKKRLSWLAAFNSGFSLLFHYQYSTEVHWRIAVETIMEEGYRLATMEEQIREYEEVLA